MEFKDVVSDWQKQFPILSPYTPPTLYAKAEIMLIGIKLYKVKPKSYKVLLEIHPLWVKEDKIRGFLLRAELLDEEGLDILLKYGLHDPELFDSVDLEAFECAHQQFGDVLQENIKLSDLFRFINSVHSRGDAHQPRFWSDIFELKLALASYFGDEEIVKEIKREIEKELRYHDRKRVGIHSYRSLEEWKDDLYRRMEDKEAFMMQVNMNLNIPIVAKLKEIHISNDIENYNDLKPHLTFLQRLKQFLGYFKSNTTQTNLPLSASDLRSSSYIPHHTTAVLVWGVCWLIIVLSFITLEGCYFIYYIASSLILASLLYWMFWVYRAGFKRQALRKSVQYIVVYILALLLLIFAKDEIAKFQIPLQNFLGFHH